jgi:hypothetical protein
MLEFLDFQGEEMRRLLPGILLLALATSLAGCNDSTTNTPTTPTTPNTPTTPATTETFTGTLHLNGAETYNFTAATGGTVLVTLTTLADGTPPIGLSLGTWTGAACQIVIDNSNAAVQGFVTGTVTSATSLCARVYDAHGTIATPADFTITAAHP